MGRAARISPTTSLDETDAWVLDLDGVLTDTARLHEHAWTEVFHELFSTTSGHNTPPPAEFTSSDYRRLVDGEDRMDGFATSGRSPAMTGQVRRR